ncbi:hypothetical protein D3C76_1318210 [compost metagenome]
MTAAGKDVNIADFAALDSESQEGTHIISMLQVRLLLFFRNDVQNLQSHVFAVQTAVIRRD